MDVDNRVTSVPTYTASQKVDLLDGFKSNYGDTYSLYVDTTITPCVQGIFYKDSAIKCMACVFIRVTASKHLYTKLLTVYFA
ncbi:MAG TPA: hypothetical protein VK559_13325 [Ferruginibacter sp.]|nr:hypothetical protein [Ferruginibacter sp.]